MLIGPFFRKREVWLPTWRASLLALIAGVALMIGFFLYVPKFLSRHKPIQGEVLVVEGWVSEHGLRTAVDLANSGGYKLVIATGGPIEKGMTISSYETYANLGAQRLRALGITGTNLLFVAAPDVPKDRTYHSALAVKAFLEKRTNYRTIDLLSSDVHSRRSWLLYRIACGPEFKVGVFADTDPKNALDKWWTSSQGVRTVLNELIGYCYVKLAFSPD